MSEELKPCPFCGQKIKLPKSRQASTDRSEGFVAFAACYCGGYSATAHKMGRGNTEAAAIQDVIALWNRRAQPAEAEGVRDYLTEFAEGEVEAKTAIEELQDALSAVTAERDRLLSDNASLRGSCKALGEENKQLKRENKRQGRTIAAMAAKEA